MPKTQASLDESRRIRSLIDSRYGIPRSVMQANWGVSAIDLSTSYQDGREQSKYAGTPFDLSGVGARHGQLSRFPQNIAQWIVKFYTPERLGVGESCYFDNDLPTVLDPTAGHNSRAEAVWRTGRNYVGHDLSAEFQKMNRKVVETLQEENSRAMIKNNAQIKLVEGDSKHTIVYPPVFDLCMTSPPYWDLEDYGPQPEQLGKNKTYKGFLRDIDKIVEHCYSALKPGAFIVWEAQDFTKKGRFYPYPFQLMQIFSRYFALHQVIIVDYGRGFFASFASDIEHSKLVSKEHSYLIVARKRWERVNRAERRKTLSQEADVALREGRLEHQSGFDGMFREIDKTGGV